MRQEAFSRDVAERRHKLRLGLREAAYQAQIAPATFGRVENRWPCDMITFEKLCRWAKLRPMKYLETK